MATFSKLALSSSTNGKGIKVTQTSTPGDSLHVAVSGTSSYDEIWLYCVNASSSDVKLTIEWGETTAPDGNIEFTVAAEEGLKCIVPGLVLQNGLVARAFASTADVLVVHGFVNRITA